MSWPDSGWAVAEESRQLGAAGILNPRSVKAREWNVLLGGGQRCGELGSGGCYTTRQPLFPQGLSPLHRPGAQALLLTQKCPELGGPVQGKEGAYQDPGSALLLRVSISTCGMIVSKSMVLTQ